MKKIFLAAAPAMALALTACQSELTEPQAPATGTAVMRVEIAYPTDGTRTTLDEVAGDNLAKLSSKWEEKDQVLVYDNEGNKLGTLAIESMDESGKKATFNGTLTAVKEGTYNYHFFYMPGNGQTAAPFTFNMAEQSGKADDLAQYDFLRSTAEVKVANEVAYTEKMGLARSTAYGHFALNFPEGVNYTDEEITVVTGQGNSCTLSAENVLDVTKGDIKVNTNDMYIAVLPQEAADITFMVTIDGIDYKGSMGRTHEWKASEFVNAGFQTGVEVNIEMEMATNYTVNYMAVKENGDAWKTAPIATVTWTDASKAEYTIGKKADGEDLAFDAEKILTDSRIEGYKVDGADVELGKAVNLDKTNNTLTVNVVVIRNTYTLQIVTSLGAEVWKATDQVLPASATVEAMPVDPVKENYTFKGWSWTEKGTTALTLQDLQMVMFRVNDRDEAEEVDGVKVITRTIYPIWEAKKLEGESPDVPGSDF